MKKLYLLLLIMTIVSLPASAQVNLSGVWDNLGTGDSFDKVLNSSVIHEDWPDRLFGPELGDYTGIPLTDAARMRALRPDNGQETRRKHGSGTSEPGCTNGYPQEASPWILATPPTS